MSNAELLEDLDDDFGTGSESEVEVRNDGDAFSTLQHFATEYRPPRLLEGSEGSFCNISWLFDRRDIILQLIKDRPDSSSALLLSKMQPLVQDEIDFLHTYLKGLYEETFPELQSIVTSGEQYARVVQLLQQSKGSPDISDFQNVVDREQILILSMALQTDYKYNKSPSGDLMHMLTITIEIILALCDLKQEMKAFVTSLISQVAPNLSELVGPETAAALIAAAGGIRELSIIPSCNIPSMGKSKFASHVQAVDQSGVRQKGFVYYCPLVLEQPILVRNQALKMTCAKVSLAARVDLSKSSPNANLGLEFRKDILHKLQNIQEPPNISNVKALPIPEDKPKKKRAGRRFRKYKEQFQLSHARQLQNRMEFGKQESTVVDVYGEEIGMGMAGSSRASKSVPTKRSAKVRAPMQRRLAAAANETHNFFSENQEHADVLKAPSNGPQINGETRDPKNQPNTNQWYTKFMTHSKDQAS
ncbi:U4/U6-U5 snRNP complex subunit PRP31 LALA0_S03e06260g [Lachancea lanzarotensis]|uniref:LALA0S03e06260g1_1 n=1 Tax=Lachancea lanzarotensis TaxID=1245769 RepID=A0A0C7N0X8_9SACH|nr:uncharacterized protein LALA0_S03e06260g [Lachancea lanzarotensis]CEP61589.1 LALA0S03e06260g1_1 [Lachancea lanzarotensis]